MATWDVMTAPAPAARPARNGGSSTRSRRARGCAMSGSPRCESTSVSPCPGKCLRVATTPPACRPRTQAEASRDTTAGSSPNERVLMTGLRGLLLTSATGAKLTCTPRARASTAVMRPASNASPSSPAAPNAIARGKVVPPRSRNPMPVSKSAAFSRGSAESAWSRLKMDAPASGCPRLERA